MTIYNTEIGAFINSLTEDTTPDLENDLLMEYDASAAAPKKVTMQTIAESMGGGDMLWAAVKASQLINEIKGWPPIVKTGDLDALNLWFDKIGTPTTAPSVVAGNDGAITMQFNEVLKVVADAAGEGLSQRFTYADEPRVKSGRRLSTLWAIWCVGGVGATLSIINSSTEETAATKVTAAAWTLVEVPNHLLAGTYCDIKIVTDGAGTIYAVPLGANIGARAFPLRPRGLRYVDAHTEKVLSDTDPAGADYTDVDFTASTSPLCVMINLIGWYRNYTNINRVLYIRRNGDVTAANLAYVVTYANSTTTYVTGTNTLAVCCDDGQVLEYKTNGAAGDTESVNLSVSGYWEWE